MHVSCVCSRSALCSRPCLCSRSACSAAWTLYDQHTGCLCARRKEWTLLRDDSIFVDWQRLKVQENVEEVSSSCDGCAYAGCAFAVHKLMLSPDQMEVAHCS